LPEVTRSTHPQQGAPADDLGGGCEANGKRLTP